MSSPSGSHLRIARGFTVVAFYMLIGKFAGAFKEMAVAFRFGVSELVDVYTLVFTAVTLLPAVWAGMLAVVFVPLIKKLPVGEQRLFSSQLMYLTLLLSTSFALILFIFMPLAVPWIWPDYSEQAQNNLILLFRGLSPMVVAMFISSQYAALLLSMEHHSNTLMEAVPSLVVGVSVLLAHNVSGVTTLVVGSLLGVTFQAFGMAAILRKKGTVPGISARFTSAGWVHFKKAMGIMTLGFLIMSVVTPIDLYFASQLGEGQVSVYGYSNRIVLLFLGLGATAVGRAILPVLAGIVDSGEKKRVGLQWASFLFLSGSVAAASAWFVLPWLIELLFERGAFTSEDTANVSEIARLGLIQFPVYFSGIVLAQLLASQERFLIIAQSSIVAVVAKLIFGTLGAMYFGLAGVVISTALMYLCTLIFLLYNTTRINP
jgi:putative peptidoglycan lipid II flippase